MLLILEKSCMLCSTKAEEYHLAFPDPLPCPPWKEKQAGAWQGMQTRNQEHSQDSPEVWEGRKNPHAFKTASQAQGKPAWAGTLQAMSPPDNVPSGSSGKRLWFCRVLLGNSPGGGMDQGLCASPDFFGKGWMGGNGGGAAAEIWWGFFFCWPGSRGSEQGKV